MLLLAIPFFYLWKFKTELLKPALIGTLRMIIQLFFIGMYLKYLFLWNNPWINFLWVIIMVFVAGQTALVRTQLKRSVLLIPITVGFLCSVVLVGLFFIGIVLLNNDTPKQSPYHVIRPALLFPFLPVAGKKTRLYQSNRHLKRKSVRL